MRKILVTGTLGQDGSNMCEYLLRDTGNKVYGMIRRSANPNFVNCKSFIDNPNFQLVQGDITDSHSIIRILSEHADVDEFYNLAAQSHVAVSFKQPALTWDITGKGCLNILQSMVDLKMNKARFYQASSSEMFGRNYDTRDCLTLEDENYQDEDTKFLPQSPYAIAKCAAHHMTRLFREGYDIHASAGILFNHEGPRRGETFVTRKITKWIGEFVESGRDPEFPRLRLGNLEAFRDWGYAGDYVEAMWMMLQQESPDDYVICTGETHTIREFLDVAFKHIGIDDWSDLVVPDPEFYRPAEVDYLRGCNDKAKEKLGWTPANSFDDLVKMMVDHDVEK